MATKKPATTTKKTVAKATEKKKDRQGSGQDCRKEGGCEDRQGRCEGACQGSGQEACLQGQAL